MEAGVAWYGWHGAAGTCAHADGGEGGLVSARAHLSPRPGSLLTSRGFVITATLHILPCGSLDSTPSPGEGFVFGSGFQVPLTLNPKPESG